MVKVLKEKRSKKELILIKEKFFFQNFDFFSNNAPNKHNFTNKDYKTEIFQIYQVF